MSYEWTAVGGDVGSCIHFNDILQLKLGSENQGWRMGGFRGAATLDSRAICGDCEKIGVLYSREAHNNYNWIIESSGLSPDEGVQVLPGMTVALGMLHNSDKRYLTGGRGGIGAYAGATFEDVGNLIQDFPEYFNNAEKVCAVTTPADYGTFFIHAQPT